MNAAFLDAFRDVVLPVIEVEVNEGSHFAPLRQVYHSLVLAKWYRENLADKGIHTSLRELGERSWREVLGGAEKSGTPETGVEDDAPEWLKDCFARYERLFREGSSNACGPTRMCDSLPAFGFSFQEPLICESCSTPCQRPRAHFG